MCFIDRWISNRRKPKRLLSVKKYSKRTAHTFEIVREVNERGEIGKCGFYLHNERPSVIRHIVPGKYTETIGLYLYVHACILACRLNKIDDQRMDMFFYTCTACTEKISCIDLSHI